MSRSAPTGASGAVDAATDATAAGSAAPDTRHRRAVLVSAVLVVLLVVGAILSATLGRYPLGVPAILQTIVAPGAHPADAQVFYDVRLVRIGAALLVGAVLALAGSAFQAVFRNPMVSPDVLGASGGAGMGASLALLFGLGVAGTQAFAFLGGLLAVLAALVVDRMIDRRGSILTLILTGMVVASLCSAVISLVKYVGDPEDKLPQITFWLLGGLSAVRPHDVAWLAAVFVVGGVALMALRWRLTALAFGDEQAATMGVDVRTVRLVTIAAATLLTAVAVSVAGIVGWVGLLVPHLARILVGADNRVALPVSALLGALFLLVVDTVSRSASGVEIPLGVLTALLGAPGFLYLLALGRRQGWI
ncbi:FecCD family ABC transporter permease [Pseudonocardia phyllosphaerae]|uniref:FecCD family ABC transporter permease n=1 Tax=Pseudonocardia phyllosphaerae TaxID=3390502 RepID=UPI003978A4B5